MHNLLEAIKNPKCVSWIENVPVLLLSKEQFMHQFVQFEVKQSCKCKEVLLKPTGIRPSLKWAKLFFSSVSKTLWGTTMYLDRLSGGGEGKKKGFGSDTVDLFHIQSIQIKEHWSRAWGRVCINSSSGFWGLLYFCSLWGGNARLCLFPAFQLGAGCGFTCWTSRSGRWRSWPSSSWRRTSPAPAPSPRPTQTSSCGSLCGGCLETVSFLEEGEKFKHFSRISYLFFKYCCAIWETLKD